MKNFYGNFPCFLIPSRETDDDGAPRGYMAMPFDTAEWADAVLVLSDAYGHDSGVPRDQLAVSVSTPGLGDLVLVEVFESSDPELLTLVTPFAYRLVLGKIIHHTIMKKANSTLVLAEERSITPEFTCSGTLDLTTNGFPSGWREPAEEESFTTGTLAYSTYSPIHYHRHHVGVAGGEPYNYWEPRSHPNEECYFGYAEEDDAAASFSASADAVNDFTDFPANKTLRTDPHYEAMWRVGREAKILDEENGDGEESWGALEWTDVNFSNIIMNGSEDTYATQYWVEPTDKGHDVFDLSDITLTATRGQQVHCIQEISCRGNNSPRINTWVEAVEGGTITHHQEWSWMRLREERNYRFWVSNYAKYPGRSKNIWLASPGITKYVKLSVFIGILDPGPETAPMFVYNSSCNWDNDIHLDELDASQKRLVASLAPSQLPDRGAYEKQEIIITDPLYTLHPIFGYGVSVVHFRPEFISQSPKQNFDADRRWSESSATYYLYDIYRGEYNYNTERSMEYEVYDENWNIIHTYEDVFPIP